MARLCHCVLQPEHQLAPRTHESKDRSQRLLPSALVRIRDRTPGNGSTTHPKTH